MEGGGKRRGRIALERERERERERENLEGSDSSLTIFFLLLQYGDRQGDTGSPVGVITAQRGVTDDGDIFWGPKKRVQTPPPRPHLDLSSTDGRKVPSGCFSTRGWVWCIGNAA